jgi:protein SCO1
VKSLAAATVAAAAFIVLSGPASATFSSNELAVISADPPPGAKLPLKLGFIDQAGRTRTLETALAGAPDVVIFADYTCHTLCGPILEFAAAGLAKTGLRPGIDYHVVVIGLDPKDGLDAVRAMESAHFSADDPIKQAAVFLTGTQPAITATTAALGYHYQYDAEHDQFAHPAAVYVTDADGEVARVLSGVGLDGADLRLALVDAGRGAIGTLGDQIRLLCYGYDPARGIYTERITFFLELAAGASVLTLAGGIFALHAAERRRAPS